MSETIGVQPRKSPKQRRSRDTVEAILDATARVLVDGGYSAASTNRIARVAGVSIGSLYQYFPNKEALVLAVAQRHSGRMLGMLREHVVSLSGASIPSTVRTYVHAIVRAHKMEPDLHAVLLPFMLTIGLEHFQPFQSQVLAVVRAWLDGHAGEILPTDLDTAAVLLTGTVESVIHGALVDMPGPTDLDALEKELCDMVLRYLLGTAD